MLRSRSHSVRAWLATACGGLAVASGITVLSGVGASAATGITLHSRPDLAAINEGFSVSAVVATFSDADVVCSDIGSETRASKWAATIDWGDGHTSAGTVSCDEGNSEDFAVSGRHQYKDSGSPASTPFAIKVKVVDQDGASAGYTQTAKIRVNDLPLAVLGEALVQPAGPIKEGQSATVSALFLDTSRFADLTGMIGAAKWPDGTTTQGTVTDVTETTPLPSEECCHVYKVTVTGTPDAGVKESEPIIGLHDDGGQTAVAGFSLVVNDAALTKGASKSFTSTATQAATNVVASFTDAAGAQAAEADFTATIKWGDNTTSSGTVTKTGTGAFDVSGTHTYATSGTKSLTITVTDEEGQTLTMSATATVPALPATGQPRGSGNSGWPLLPLGLILLGLIAASVGILRTRLAAR